MCGPEARLDEDSFIARLRAIATDPAARGLNDDAAVLKPPAGQVLVLTKDLLVEGVHYLANDPPADVAWKLVAVNLSDLAAKGAAPLGVLLGYTLRDAAWDEAFADGLASALDAFAVPLLGGDTVSGGGTRTLSMTAIGAAPAGGVPARSGARPGDLLWVSGTIGDAGEGLARALSGAAADDSFVQRYRRPTPRLAVGGALGPFVHAMTDISDGLLIDAARMAAASACGIVIDLDAVPADRLLDRAGRLAAVTAGDDYELLFTTTPRDSSRVFTISQDLGLSLILIGRCEAGSGLSLHDGQGAVPLPTRLGYEHARDLGYTGEF